MTLKTVYDLTISTLTPLHIGSGEKLEKDFDYAVAQGQTWVLNQEEIAEKFFFDENGRYLSQLESTPPANLLKNNDFQPDSSLFRYIMRGTPRAVTTGSAVQAQIKNVFDEPYLPGSSLKGALRTIIFREAFAASKIELASTHLLERNRKWAARSLEQELLGKNPNYDLLRTLHVSDSDPITADNLQMLNAQVFGRTGAGSPISLECVKGDAVFQSTLTIDNYLFQDKQKRKLRFTATQESWVRHLAQHANAQAYQRIQQELQFYQERKTENAAAFYRQLAGLTESFRDKGREDMFLLQVGWGGGWDSKTLAYLVSDADKEELIYDYDLAKGHRKAGQPFPKSRRAIAGGPAHAARAMAPLGWLLIEMKQR